VADAPVSAIVRFAVWCRDRGRCVDCGTAEDLCFDEILPAAHGGSRSVANTELRCDACRQRRALNEDRARVGRARAAVAPFARYGPG
jgi:5-methylcytosine-specific restriction endonuclease McrA